ncbi:THUMP domain-containing protein 1-like isoform X2 [Amphiura filiformis]
MAEIQQESGGQHNRGQKRSKSYYVRAKEGKRVRKDTMLTVGMRGFLLTCNHGVKPCVKEAYNLLTEYADELYGPEKDGDEEVEQSPASEDEEDECEDMEASLQKEIAGMKQKRQGRKQRFQAVESGAKNVAFIKANQIENPCELVHRILTDIQQTKTSKSRHIMRMLPVTASVRSYIEDIEKQAPRILKPHFECDDGQELSFCIMFKVRNCGHLKRDDVITTLHRIVTGMGKHRVDLNHAERVILVEGVRNVCCISVLEDFFKLRKYNLQAITEEFVDKSKEQGKSRWNRKPKKSSNNSTSDVTQNQSVDKVEDKSSESKIGDVTDDTNGDKECVDGKPEEGQGTSDVKASEDDENKGEELEKKCDGNDVNVDKPEMGEGNNSSESAGGKDSNTDSEKKMDESRNEEKVQDSEEQVQDGI